MSTGFSICVLISGGGTTLRNLIEWRDAGTLGATICHVVSSKPDAGGLEFARGADIPATVIDHREYPDFRKFSDRLFKTCRETGADLIVMGGFLRRVCIPDDFSNRVINIHPSLIPAFSGEGFYGRRVHQAVLDYGCKVSGCTAHFVDDQFDHGPIIAQRTVPVESGDNADTLAARVFAQECMLYPDVVNLIAAGRVKAEGRIVITVETRTGA